MAGKARYEALVGTLCLLAALAGGLLPCGRALAQTGDAEKGRQQLPVDESLKKDITWINSVLIAGRFSNPAEEQRFDKFYENYYLARWTQEKNLSSLHNFRKDLRISHLGRKSAGTTVHDHLSKLVLDFMKKLSVGPYHPAVQVNAMLMIGELNSVEWPQPAPMPEALDVLLAATESGKYPDAVRVAAVIGIQRHAADGISDPNAAKAVASAMLKLAGEDMPSGAARAAREWIRAQALETLARLGSVGENNAVFNSMVKTLVDEKLSLSTRGIAAESLGRLNYSNASGISSVDTAGKLAQFLLDACAEETRQSKNAVDPVMLRRLMRQRVSEVCSALTGEEENRKGIASLAREASQQALLGDLQKSIEATAEFLDDKKHEAEELQGPVEELQGKLEAWLKKTREG
jgi:hypothetical protein